MNFVQLVQYLSRRVGHHQIPIRPSASGVRELLESSALHYELMMQVITAVYARNRCRQITDRVSRDATFEALAPIRMEVLRSSKTDVDAVQLIEALGSVINDAFVMPTPVPAAATAVTEPRPPSGPAPIVNIDRFRHRRFKTSA